MNVDDHPLFLETLSGFAQTLVRPYDVDAVLTDLIQRLSVVLDLSGGGVTLWEKEEPRYVAALNASAAELEHVQSASGQGPCMQAYRTGRLVPVSDLHDMEEEWPAYCAVAREQGVRAAAGVPLVLVGEPIGALNLYSATPRTWSPRDLQVARVLADMATSYLVNASKLDQQRQLNQQLLEALESRVLIEQAKGVVAARRGTTVEVAFELIRKHARQNNSKLHAVAEAIVHAGLRV